MSESADAPRLTQAQRLAQLSEQIEQLRSAIEGQAVNLNQLNNREAETTQRLPNRLRVIDVTVETPEINGLETLNISKLVPMVCKLKKDMSNFSTWETSLLNALDLIDIDQNALDDMTWGRKRPSHRLNKLIRTLIHQSIDKDDRILHNKLRPLMTQESPSYRLNSSIAMLETIKVYYRSQVENREEVLLRRLKTLRFNGANLIKYNSEYLDVYYELLEMNSVSNNKKEIREYIDSLGAGNWIYDVRKVFENTPDQEKSLEKIMEIAVQMFLIQFPDGGLRPVRPNNVFSRFSQNERPYASRIITKNENRAYNVAKPKGRMINNCPFCTKSHTKGSCPAYGKDCSYCGQKNHFKKACRKLKQDQRNDRKNHGSNDTTGVVANVEELTQEAENIHRLNDGQNMWVLNVTQVSNRDDSDDSERMLLDSGASASLTWDKRKLKNYKDGNTYFETAGKEKLRIEGYGYLTIRLSFGNITIRCGYAPTLARGLTLIAVRDLLHKNIMVQFGKHSKDNLLIRNGRKHYLKSFNNCYILSTSSHLSNVDTKDNELIDTHEKWMMWHRRLAHASPTKMLYTGILGARIKIPKQLMVCEKCQLANVSVQSFEINRAVVEELHASKFKIQSDTLYADYKVLEFGYILHMLYNQWTELVYLDQKQDAESVVFLFIASLEIKPRKVITDDDTPFKTTAFRTSLAKIGIIVKLVPPLHHQLNMVEPRIRYSMEKIRAILLDIDEEDMRDDLFEYVVGYVSFVINRIGLAPTPFEIRYKKKPSLKLLKPFLARCVIPKLRRPNNLEPKGEIVHFVGYDRYAAAPTCLLWNPDSGRIIRRAFIDIRWLLMDHQLPNNRHDLKEASVMDTTDIRTNNESADATAAENDEYSHHESDLSDTESEGAIQNPSLDVDSPVLQSGTNNQNVTASFQDWSHMRGTGLGQYGSTNQSGQRRSTRLMIHAVLQKDEIHYGHDLRRANESVRAKYQIPIDKEVQNLWKHKVIENVRLTQEQLKGNKILNSQFVLAEKRDGTLKARWVVCGNQQGNLNVFSTYTPTVNRNLILLLLKIALNLELSVQTLDVSSAYLYGKLPVNEQVYIRAPYPLPHKIYKVVGNLYGLKQAGRVWNQIFSNDLEQFGLKASRLDPCLFYKSGKSPMFLLLHVDDGLLLAKGNDGDRLIAYLQKKFEIQLDKGEDFLGLQINPDGMSIAIRQENYINKILKKYGFLDSRPSDTPMVYHAQLMMADPNNVIDDISEFQSLLGSLSFCRLTRPDLLFVLHELATVAASPGPDALQAAKRAFRYLRGTSHGGIKITKDFNEPWICYVDASFAAGSDLRSIAGHTILIGGTPIISQSYTIRQAVDSSAHAEAYALHGALKDVLFLRNIYDELFQQKPKVTIYTDSKALLDFSFKSGSGKRSRHWDIALHYIKEHIGPDKDIKLEFVDGENNTADIFTKSLGKSSFEKHRANLLHLRLD